jgi:uncharacterized protein DUF3108
MKRLAGFCFVLLCALALSHSTGAQMGMGMRGPSVTGVWSPVVGSGAAYQMENKREGKREIEIAIVAAETAAGKPGHWMEMSFKDPKSGQMVMRQMMALEGKEMKVLRMVFQQGDEEPIEMPMQMMAMMGGQQRQQKSDVRSDAEKVGTESITTPAGTFECEHWRSKDKSSDYWVSEKISPWGLVKMTSPDESMVLVRVVTNAKTKIRGTPRVFDPSQMMQRPN